MNPRFFFFFFLFFLSFSFIVEATGINTYRIEDRTIVFKPGFEKTLGFKIFGGEALETIFEPGDLKGYAYVEDPNPRGGERTLKLTVKFPDTPVSELDIETGDYTIIIGALDVTGELTGMMVARTAIKTSVLINVLNQEKDLKAKLSIDNHNRGEDAKLNLDVISWSYQNISDVKINFFVYDYDGGKELATSTSHINLLPATETITLDEVLATKSFSPGQYFVRAVITFANKQIEVSDSFIIGELGFSIVNMTKEIITGRIGKLSVILESSWNDPMQDLHAKLNVGRDVFKSENFDYIPGGEIEFPIFVDTQWMTIGKHTGTLEIYSKDRLFNIFDISFEVISEPDKENPLSLNTLIIIFALSVLVLGLLVINTISLFKKQRPHEDFKQIKKFVSQKKKEGYSKKEIRNALIDAGWSERDIDTVLEKKKLEAPKPAKKKT